MRNPIADRYVHVWCAYACVCACVCAWCSGVGAAGNGCTRKAAAEDAGGGAAAAGNAASGFLTGYLRKKSAGGPQQREQVHAAPLAQRPRSSVHPMQGSILSWRPKSGPEMPGEAFYPPADASALGVRAGAHAPLSSASTGRIAQQYRDRLVRTPENAMRKSGGWYAGNTGEAQGAHVDVLHQRLEALASRLSNVDERSLRLQELLQHNEESAGESPSRNQFHSEDASPYPLTSSPPTPSAGGWAAEGLSSARGGVLGSARGASAGDRRRLVATPLQDSRAEGNQRLAARPHTSGAALGVVENVRGQASNAGGVAGQNPDGGGDKEKMPKAVTNILHGIQDTMVNLEYIFIKASRSEHEAATRINKVARFGCL